MSGERPRTPISCMEVTAGIHLFNHKTSTECPLHAGNIKMSKRQALPLGSS